MHAETLKGLEKEILTCYSQFYEALETQLQKHLFQSAQSPHNLPSWTWNHHFQSPSSPLNPESSDGSSHFQQKIQFKQKLISTYL